MTVVTTWRWRRKSSRSRHMEGRICN